jgi:hypothetical protein
LDFGGRVGVVKEGLDLKKVILLGKTFEEYCHYFGLTPGDWKGKKVLDVKSQIICERELAICE